MTFEELVQTVESIEPTRILHARKHNGKEVIHRVFDCGRTRCVDFNYTGGYAWFYDDDSETGAVRVDVPLGFTVDFIRQALDWEETGDCPEWLAFPCC